MFAASGINQNLFFWENDGWERVWEGYALPSLGVPKIFFEILDARVYIFGAFFNIQAKIWERTDTLIPVFLLLAADIRG